MYGTDANKDGRKDPYNPVDAIFAAARYLKAAGYENDVRRAIFAYNHADWYVDSVLLRARLIAGVPADLIGSLTGLTEGRFPVYARARYADDLAERERSSASSDGQNAANVIESPTTAAAIDIFARSGAPVVAVNDGVIKKIGSNDAARPLRRAPGRLRQPLHLRAPRLGRRSTTRCRSRTPPTRRAARAVKANGDDADPKPAAPASAGRQPTTPTSAAERRGSAGPRDAAAGVACRSRSACSPIPDMAGAREAGGLEQMLDSKARKDGTLRDLPQLLLAPVRAEPAEGPPAPPARARA